MLHLFLGCGCALGKLHCYCCSCLGETRQGLGYLGFRGAGCWICSVGVVLGSFLLQGLGVASQGSWALKTCFTRGFTAELWFWPTVEDCSDWKKGGMDTWQNCCVGGVLRQKWQMNEAMLYRGRRGWGQTVPSCLWKLVTAFQKVVYGCLSLATEGRRGLVLESGCLLFIFAPVFIKS